MGGIDSVSAQQLTVIEQCARVRVLLNAIDAWIFEQPSRAMNKSKRTVSPVVLQRQKLADSLVRYLSLLGLERKAETLTLEAYVEGTYGGNGEPEGAPEPPGDEPPDFNRLKSPDISRLKSSDEADDADDT
jgi:hypothetical protein